MSWEESPYDRFETRDRSRQRVVDSIGPGTKLTDVTHYKTPLEDLKTFWKREAEYSPEFVESVVVPYRASALASAWNVPFSDVIGGLTAEEIDGLWCDRWMNDEARTESRLRTRVDPSYEMPREDASQD